MNFSHIDFSADAVGCPYLALVLLSNKVDIKRVWSASTPSGDPRTTWLIAVVDPGEDLTWWKVNLRTRKVVQAKRI